MEFIPKYIKRTEEKRASEVITNDDWNTLFNLVINQGDWNTKALVDLCEELKLYSNTAEIIEMINEKVKEINSADMLKADYDTNSDGIVNKADTVVDGGIKTSSIQDGAITEVKLENVLKSRINYCYSKVGLLLVLVSAQNEITGSENLNVFGLDGVLETGYGIEIENTALLLNTEGYYTGAFNIKHYSQTATQQLTTVKKYTLTNNSDLDIVKLTEIIDANFSGDQTNSKIVTIPQYIGGSTNIRRDEKYHGYIVHVRDNYYYLILPSDYERTKQDTLHECLLVYIVTFDGNAISIGSPVAVTCVEMENIMLLGDYLFVQSDDNLQSIGESQIDIFNLAGEHKSLIYYNDSDEKNAYFTYASNGNVYWSNYWRDDRETELCKYTFSSGSQSRLLTLEDVSATSAVTVSPITGRWGTVRTKDSEGVYTYYILDMHSGALTKIEQNSTTYNDVYTSHDCVRDTDGVHFYRQGNKYRIDESGMVRILVNTIKNGTIINDVDSESGWVHNNMFILGEQVYSIINNTVLPIYAVKRVNSWSGQRSASMGVKNLNTGLYLEDVTGDSYSWKIVPYTYTEGSITLETALDKDMLGELYIKRQQSCTINSNEIKHIYLKPTVTNTFNALNLIVYLSREIHNDDSLIVTVNNTILTPLEASTSTTKYYELALGEATSDFEVIITAKAGATGQLQLTQILGGVDNAV